MGVIPGVLADLSAAGGVGSVGGGLVPIFDGLYILDPPYYVSAFPAAVVDLREARSNNNYMGGALVYRFEYLARIKRIQTGQDVGTSIEIHKNGSAIEVIALDAPQKEVFMSHDIAAGDEIRALVSGRAENIFAKIDIHKLIAA